MLIGKDFVYSSCFDMFFMLVIRENTENIHLRYVITSKVLDPRVLVSLRSKEAKERASKDLCQTFAHDPGRIAGR